MVNLAHHSGEPPKPVTLLTIEDSAAISISYAIDKGKSQVSTDLLSHHNLREGDYVSIRSKNRNLRGNLANIQHVI